MKINRREIRRMILQEMDMAGMGVDPDQLNQALEVAKTVLALGVTMGSMVAILLMTVFPGVAFQVIEEYHRGLLSEEEFKAMLKIKNEQGVEAAGAYFDSVVREKGYDPGGMGPVHRGSGKRDASYAQAYNRDHGDILPPSSFDFDDEDM